jgi:hypothetical protein
MLRKLKFTGVLLAVVMLAGGTMMFVQAKDLRRNYTLVDASIVSVSVDCFIQAGRKKVLVKGTKDLLYMDCALAPDVAAHFGFRAKDVHKRAQVAYEYTSPADRSVHGGTYVRTRDVDGNVVGRKIRVHAHKSVPEDSRTLKGNVFIADTGA